MVRFLTHSRLVGVNTITITELFLGIMQEMLQLIFRYIGNTLVFDNLIELIESYLKRADKA